MRRQGCRQIGVRYGRLTRGQDVQLVWGLRRRYVEDVPSVIKPPAAVISVIPCKGQSCGQTKKLPLGSFFVLQLQRVAVLGKCLNDLVDRGLKLCLAERALV